MKRKAEVEGREGLGKLEDRNGTTPKLKSSSKNRKKGSRGKRVKYYKGQR